MGVRFVTTEFRHGLYPPDRACELLAVESDSAG
jgi:hypothetical protein